MEDLTELLCQLWAASQAYCDVKNYIPVHLVKPPKSGFCFMQLHSTSVSKKGHGSSPKRPAGLSWEVGLDFSCVSRHCGRYRGTETVSVRGRKNLLAMPLVRLNGKVDGEPGQSSPMGEFEQKLNDPNWCPRVIRFESNTG